MGAPARIPLIPLPSWLAGSRAPAGATGALGVAEDVQRRVLIGRILQVGGTADRGDLELIRAELERLPTAALRAFLDKGGRVTVCRGDVLDAKPELAEGGFLRGHDPVVRGALGRTWRGMPGGAFGDEVVIAVIGHNQPSGPHVPRAGEGHGSSNLVFHEMFHVIDGSGDRSRSDSDAFQDARDADWKSLTDYERQPGEGGLEETYAESAAGYYGGDPQWRERFPHLALYWEMNPLQGHVEP